MHHFFSFHFSFLCCLRERSVVSVLLSGPRTLPKLCNFKMCRGRLLSELSVPSSYGFRRTPYRIVQYTYLSTENWCRQWPSDVHSINVLVTNPNDLQHISTMNVYRKISSFTCKTQMCSKVVVHTRMHFKCFNQISSERCEITSENSCCQKNDNEQNNPRREVLYTDVVRWESVYIRAEMVRQRQAIATGYEQYLHAIEVKVRNHYKSSLKYSISQNLA